ncbi:MAG TPA: DUF1080 domain-containing protein [Opitutaceae bacterium]
MLASRRLLSLFALALIAGSPGLRAQTAPAPTPAAAAAAAAAPAARPQPDPIDFNDTAGWQSLFDGSTLAGWDGNPAVWRVTDGAMVGEYTSPEGTRNPSTFLIWKGGEPADFELKLEIKMEGATADSGIQYRGYYPTPAAGATPAPGAQWAINGYQYDFNFINTFNANLAEAGQGRGVIAFRGQMVRTEAGKRPRLLSQLGTFDGLGGHYRVNDWNQIHLIARGNTLVQMMNGHVMAILIDEDVTKLKTKGLIGLQCAGPGSVRISFRNVWLKTL